jgi:flagellar protein FlaG
MNISQVSDASVATQALSNVTAMQQPRTSVVTPVKGEFAKAVASPEQVEQAVAKINDVVQAINQGIEFKVEDNFRSVIVSVVDTSNKEVIRQIPTEDAISISQALEKLQGLLLKQTV